jgi:hypothetical protein
MCCGCVWPLENTRQLPFGWIVGELKITSDLISGCRGRKTYPEIGTGGAIECGTISRNERSSTHCTIWSNCTCSSRANLTWRLIETSAGEENWSNVKRTTNRAKSAGCSWRGRLSHPLLNFGRNRFRDNHLSFRHDRSP